MKGFAPKSKMKRRENIYGIIFMAPVFLGIIAFTLIPMITSLVYSLHDYLPHRFENQLDNFGLQNYIKIFTALEEGGERAIVFRSFYLTFRYAVLSVALTMFGSYCLALFLNQKVKGIGTFRVIYYLPCLVPAMVSTLLWKDITDYDTGYINIFLMNIGLERYTFYQAKETVLPTLLILGIPGWGGSTVMWLAQMKNIPAEMYEAADLDGANYFQKLIRITVPMTTSMIFYQLITSIIGALQQFSAVYPLRNGISDSELDFIVVKIYNAAFNGAGGMSYACALSWVLFLVIGLVTLTVFKTSKWVYYGEEA